MKRNLVYFAYPKKGSIWRWNVETMRGYLDRFNGRMILVISRDANAESPDAVLDAFGNTGGFEVDIVGNDPKLREMRWFLRAFGSLESGRSDEATFYAHTKGVTHGHLSNNMMAWAGAMYHLNLERVDLVDRLLGSLGYHAVGTYRYTMPMCGSSWHYSGTFFWLLHSAIFSVNWRSIKDDIRGLEAYPGRHIPLAASFNMADGQSYGNLYQKPPPMDAVRNWLPEIAKRIEAANPAHAAPGIHLDS